MTTTTMTKHVDKGMPSPKGPESGKFSGLGLGEVLQRIILHVTKPFCNVSIFNRKTIGNATLDFTVPVTNGHEYVASLHSCPSRFCSLPSRTWSEYHKLDNCPTLKAVLKIMSPLWL